MLTSDAAGGSQTCMLLRLGSAASAAAQGGAKPIPAKPEPAGPSPNPTHQKVNPAVATRRWGGDLDMLLVLLYIYIGSTLEAPTTDAGVLERPAPALASATKLSLCPEIKLPLATEWRTHRRAAADAGRGRSCPPR